jgi:CHAD domain-containing protein
MSRVLKALRRVRTSMDVEAVHRLRVALRRCRSLAVLMEEVDPHPAWKEMKRLSRKLFRRLGALRDTQVLEHEVKELAPQGDSMRKTLSKVLEDREVEPRARVRRAVKQFDRKAWKRLAQTLRRHARVVPTNSLAAQCLVLERFEEVRRLHARALPTERPRPWHELRIAVKRFRYAVESLLPARTAVWEGGLQRMQDLLGQIHDLGVLDSFVVKEGAGVAADSLRHAIAAARKGCIQQYCHRARGGAGVLREWKAGLPQGARAEAAATARLGAMARAMDPHPRRTAHVSQLALRLFDALAASGLQARFRDDRARVIVRAASQLHGIRSVPRHKSREESVRDILSALPAPPGWSSDDWEMVTLAVRYHRGTEPKPTHSRFARLRKPRQDLVRGLAGVLRIARALYRCGATISSQVRVDETSAGVRLCIPGLIDTRENVARLAAAKHLLEIYLRRSLLIESLRTPASSSAKPSVGRRLRRPRAANERRLILRTQSSQRLPTER